MFDENEIAVAAQLVPGIGDDTGIRGLHGGAPRRTNIDPIVMSTVRA
jgi:hypothetical protein